MSEPSHRRQHQHHEPHDHHDEGTWGLRHREDCEDGLRNRFFRGKTLGAAEFRIEQQYFLERRRLINRAMFGWGVVYGFGVHLRGQPPSACNQPGPCVEQNRQWIDSVRHGSLIIAPGFALDRQGRELVTTALETLAPLETFVLQKHSNNCEVLSSVDNLQAGDYLLAAHYAERGIEPVSTHDACSCDHDEHRFQCETVVYSLQALCDACPCGEATCQRFDCAAADACSDEDSPRSHAYQCQRTRLAATVPTRLRRWGKFLIDPRAAVPLACVAVSVSDDACEKFRFSAVHDPCGPRRVVKNNNLLFDLIRGCDLTRIAAISWQDLHRAVEPVSWWSFADKFPDPEPPDCKEIATGFFVHFSRPVRVDTVTPDAFTMTVVTTERGTGWREPRRVPITSIDHTPDLEHHTGKCDLPPGTTNRARLVVDAGWVKDEFRTGESRFAERHTLVEIEIFGSLILDCDGVAIDADARGLDAQRTGNGTPGGVFRSVFRVEARQYERKRPPDRKDDHKDDHRDDRKDDRKDGHDDKNDHKGHRDDKEHGEPEHDDRPSHADPQRPEHPEQPERAPRPRRSTRPDR